MIDMNFLLNSLSTKADWIGLRYVQECSKTRHARNGQLDPITTMIDEGIMVEVLSDGQFASAGTHDISVSGVQKAANQALQQAKHLKKYQLNQFNDAVRPPSKGHYQSPGVDSFNSSQSKDINDLAITLCQKLKLNDQIISTSVVLISIDQHTAFVSTNGADFSQDIHQRALHLSATAQTGSVIQTRSNGVPLTQNGDEFFQEQRWLEETEKVAREAIELTQADECPEGLYDLILMPDQLYLQIHESIGHPIELDRILGDERNYAGWSFIKLEDFGHLQYGSPLLNITFDPSLTHEFASYGFDDTGAPAEHQYLIKDGILLRGLGSLESQQRSGVPGVASARASSWNRPPIDRMANINLEPGSSTLEDMISSTERGILMKTNKSWSIDDYRNKFQFGCEYGQLIENGRLTKTLKNPNYRGVSTPFWKSLKMVGNPSTFEIHGALTCGKGEPNQVIRVGHATPPCLFSQVEVFGGGKI